MRTARGGARHESARPGTGRAARPVRTKPYAWHAWPANDNRPPAWRRAVAWTALAVGAGSFAYVAVTLLL